MAAGRRNDVLAIALLLLILAAVFADVLAGSGVFFFRDFSRYYFPVKKMLRDIAMAGEFPWWTRAYGGGQPLAANPEHEVFYPLNWLILLPRYVYALHLQVLLHIAIGLAAMYAFLRSLGLRIFPSFFGAISFGLGGMMLSKINMPPFLFSVGWMPLSCLFARRFILAPARKTFALAVVFLGMQFLIGEPTTVVQTAILIGGYALWRMRNLAAIGRAALVGAGGLLLGAVQIIPAIDFVRDSSRRSFAYETVALWSMPWGKLVELFFPNALGHLFVNGLSYYWGASLYGAQRSPFMPGIYPGLMITLLAIAMLLCQGRRAAPLALLAAMSVVVAAGSHTPLLRWLHAAGIASLMRYPEKFILMALFAIAIAAAQGMERLQGGDGRVRSATLSLAAVATAIAVALFLFSLTPAYAAKFQTLFSLPPGVAAAAVRISRYDWLIAAIRGALIITLLATARLAARPGWMLAATAVLVADLAHIAPEIAPRMSPEIYTPPPAVAALQRGPFRLFHEADWLRGSRTARQWAAEGRDYWVYRNGLFPMLPAAWGIETVFSQDVDRTDLLPTVSFNHAAALAQSLGGERAIAPLMAASNARYRAVYRPFDPREAARDPATLQPVTFLDMVRAPRYFFANPVVYARTVDDFAARLAAGAFPSSAAFVAERIDVDAGGRVLAVAETSSTATIDVESFGRALLVISVTPHRYWHILIDGARVHPIATNAGFQSAIVPRGRHRVEMRYRNPVILACAWISGLTAAAIAALLLRRA